MRPIDGDRLMMHLTDWWYSSFGQSETDESKAIKTVLDKIEQSLGMFAIEQDRWIPVTERLPEDCSDVLVWFEYFRYGSYNRLYQTHGIGNCSAKYGTWIVNYATGWNKLRVIAWKPLPEPYTEEEV